MRDLNEGADSNRLQQYGERASGRHPNGHGQWTRQPYRYPRFDRGSIRQIMLVQNATFRSQVYELHRLYNRQKELMEELKKKEPYGYLQADTSHSNPYTSPIPSDATNKMQHIPHLRAASTRYTKEPVTMNDEKVVPINFLKGSSVQSGRLLNRERSTQENDLLDSKHKRHSRRMFDLLLPADVYIDCEDAEKPDKEIVDESSSVNMFPLNSTRAADHENGVKLSLGTSEGLNIGESCKSDSCTQNGVTARGLDDLNEPVEENFSERAGKNTSTVESFSTGPSKEDFSMPSEAPQPKFKKPVEILSPMDQNKRGMSVRRKQGQGVEISGRRPPASISMELDFSRGYPQLKKPSCCAMQQGTEISLQDTSSISQESRRRKSEASGGPSSKRRLSASRGGGEQPVTGSAKCSRKDEKKAASSKTRRSSGRGLRNCINLNSGPSSREMAGSEAPTGIASRPDDALAEEAAENILWMFSSKEQSHLDPSDTLHWFAEVVSAGAASLDDGSDLFEQMTLELEETRPEDYFRRPWKAEDQNGGGGRKSNAASLLLAKPRRGQGKKRRQRRDFQRDILPGLASLSRREVAEDIQAFAALMRASGQSWQPGVTKRRNRGRDVTTTSSRARPRRQARRSVATAAEAQETNNNNSEVEGEGGSNVGRGACRRRTCRQRQ